MNSIAVMILVTMNEDGRSEARRAGGGDGGLKLSWAEKKGIKLGKQIVGGVKGDEWHAVGKVPSEKPISSEGIQQTLGRIWCADRGMIYKEMGDNLFLFHFNHQSGERRALEDGPWMAGHSLLVMVKYDGKCMLESMEFNHILIWIRVSGLPMGMMNKKVAEIIGEDIGQFLDVDAEENGSAASRYLRIKVRIDIHQPLRRGVTIEIEGEEEEKRWCPKEYEFLPKFCYSCGIIGHTDMMCAVGTTAGEIRQYNKKLCVLPPRWRFSEEIKAKQFSGRPKDISFSRSNGDWRHDKEDRLLLGQSGVNHVGTLKGERINSNEMMGGGGVSKARCRR
jgi:hypothetical protein